eukprot:13296005-Ditylum_brightwellii.AAC.1
MSSLLRDDLKKVSAKVSIGTADTDVRRHRTPYNLFFQTERALSLKELCPDTIALEKHSSYLDDALAEPELPWRYRKQGLANPLVVMRNNKRRKHRKTHGKIGLIQMSQMIAGRWREADSAIKKYFQHLAHADYARYKREALEAAEIRYKREVPKDVELRMSSGALPAVTLIQTQNEHNTTKKGSVAIGGKHQNNAGETVSTDTHNNDLASRASGASQGALSGE